MDTFNNIPSSRFLVCVDSDGCAMDTMNKKHLECFGPQWVAVFGLRERAEEAMSLWLSINLYSHTRGINRFAGLAMACREMVRRGAQIEDLAALEAWVAETNELSEPALREYVHTHPSPCLERTLKWTVLVNNAIAALPKDDQPFPHVFDGLAQISRYADVIGVSSANAAAVNAEWERHGLRQYTRQLCCQEAGTKAQVIRRLLSCGYPLAETLMVGDAFGDREAAEQNGVHFFPILVGREGESWKRLTDEIFPLLVRGRFDEALQKELNDEMEQILQ